MAETQSVTAGVILPGLQAGVSAGFAALAIGGIGRVAQWEGWPDGAMFSAGIVGLTVWVWQLGQWTERAKLEVMALFPDQPQAEPTPAQAEPAPVAPVRVHLVSEDERHVDILDLPTSAEKLAALAAAILEGATFSEAQWTGSGALFGRAEFQQLRSELIRRGLLAWASPNAPARGVQLTRPGRAAFKYFASLTGSGPTGVK